MFTQKRIGITFQVVKFVDYSHSVFITSYDTEYSRLDQVTFKEDSL